jgi:proline racemase
MTTGRKDKMKFSRMISAVDTHTMGEAARLIIGGIPKFPGKTMEDKKSYLAQEKDGIRRVLMHEPRGHTNMFGAFICEPINEQADYGIIFMDGGGYLNMCGHNTIAAMTAAVECGWVDVPHNAESVTVVQDTPAGLVRGIVNLKDSSSVHSVSFENVPSFLYKEAVAIRVPQLGIIHCDIAFGGNFFAILPATEINLDIVPENVGKITERALAIRKAVNEQVHIEHPTIKQIKTVDLVEIYGPAKTTVDAVQNIVVFGDGQIDRSPCGTGTSAKLATLYAKGKMNIGDRFIHESIIGTKFKGEIVKEVQLGKHRAIIPKITGSAYITGFNNFLVDPTDSLRGGFFLPG